MGGEKRSLMISDDIKLSNDELLNSFGFPAELYYGTLGLQSSPMALRLLENNFGLTAVYNHILKWVLKKATSYAKLSSISVKFAKLKWADDMERRQMLIQLAAADKISDISILEQYGMDYEEEQHKKLKQIRLLNKLQAEASEQDNREQQMSSDSGGRSSGGTPMDIQDNAQVIAQQLLGMPESIRRSELSKYSKQDRLLYSAIKTEMETQRNSDRTAGAYMVQQQRAQGGM